MQDAHLVRMPSNSLEDLQVFQKSVVARTQFLHSLSDLSFGVIRSSEINCARRRHEFLH
jgi:hypothetical protein